MVENQVPSFFSGPLWKSILFWFFPLLAFFASAYIVAFSKDSLIFNVWSCGILLHPIVSIPIGVTIDFIFSWFKKCWNKCQSEKRFAFVYTMPLHLAVVCLSQIFLTLEWSTFHEKYLLTTNLTLRASFDNYLSFDQCCNQKPCVTSGAPGLDIGEFISGFVTQISKLVNESNFSTTLPIVYYILMAATILMVLYFMIECCMGKIIPMLEFIIGPALNDDEQAETEQSTSGNEIPTNVNMNSRKKTILVSQIVCCICVILYVIALWLSPGLFNRALISKLVVCEDGLWDDNPDNPLHCIGIYSMFALLIFFNCQ